MGDHAYVVARVDLHVPTGETNDARNGHDDLCPRQAGGGLEDPGLDVEQPRGGACPEIVARANGCKSSLLMSLWVGS